MCSQFIHTDYHFINMLGLCWGMKLQSLSKDTNGHYWTLSWRIIWYYNRSQQKIFFDIQYLVEIVKLNTLLKIKNFLFPKKGGFYFNDMILRGKSIKINDCDLTPNIIRPGYVKFEDDTFLGHLGFLKRKTGL